MRNEIRSIMKKDYVKDSKERIQWLDVAKGIAIICTIIGHTVAFGSQTRNLIFSFHMPLFFLLSGYTIKTISKDKMFSATWKDFKRLVFPFFVLGFVNVLLLVMLEDAEFIPCLKLQIKRFMWGNGNDYLEILFEPPIKMFGVGVIWFLVALFWGKLAYRIFDRTVSKNRVIFLMFLSFIGIWISNVTRLPQCFDMIPLIMLFIEGGRIIREEVNPDSIVWKCLGIISFFIWIYFAWDKGIYIELATRKYPYTMLSVLIAFLGCICVIQFSQAIEKLKISEPLIFVGKNSLELLCIHYLDLFYDDVWSINYFSPNSTLYFTNEIMSCTVRVLMDVLILIAWCIIKKLLYYCFHNKLRLEKKNV